MKPLSDTDWLYFALGALALGGLGYGIYWYWQGQQWPPSASAQQSVTNEILAANTLMGGSAPSTSDLADLNAAVAMAPAAYAATLPPGTSPTTAGYQAWVTNWLLSCANSGASSLATCTQLPGGVPLQLPASVTS